SYADKVRVGIETYHPEALLEELMANRAEKQARLESEYRSGKSPWS
ncbi:unnamed protein product, partial [Urochloa humidicola]